MVLFTLVMVSTLGFLIVLQKRDRNDPVRPWTLISAVVLNFLGLAVPLMGYTAFFLILAWSAFTGAVVAAISPRWGWLVGTVASTWFLFPYLVWNAATASPDYVAAYGYVPWNFLGQAIAFGSIGAGMASALQWVRNWNRPILSPEQTHAPKPPTTLP